MSVTRRTSGEAQSAPIQVLIENQERFLSFLERRLDSRDTASDILQSAYLTGLEREETLRDRGKVVSWFYRLLRNAVVDHYRHADAEKRSLERFGFERDTSSQLAPEVEQEICNCILSLIPALRPEYRQLIREVDLGGEEIAKVADRLAITTNNARVRLFRARRALRRALIDSCGVCAEHACLDCDCRGANRTRT